MLFVHNILFSDPIVKLLLLGHYYHTLIVQNFETIGQLKTMLWTDEI